MKRIIIVAALVAAFIAPAWAATCPKCGCDLESKPAGKLEFVGAYDYFIQPNGGNNYTDAQGFRVGVEHPLVGPLSASLELTHITDVRFLEARDPKGAWGELRAWGGLGSLKLKLPDAGRVSSYLKVGAEYLDWNFYENPWLQDRDIKVEVSDALGVRAGGGIGYRITDNVTLSVGASWFQSTTDKDISENVHGIENILDAGDTINVRYIDVTAEVKGRW